jgi:inosine-uridine nucleoside N-ribohydrolase
MGEKYIIDVDTGVDDAQAIMLALSRPDIQVVGITCVAGNVDVDQVCVNTLKVLSVCDRLDVRGHCL